MYSSHSLPSLPQIEEWLTTNIFKMHKFIGALLLLGCTNTKLIQILWFYWRKWSESEKDLIRMLPFQTRILEWFTYDIWLKPLYLVASDYKFFHDHAPISLGITKVCIVLHRFVLYTFWPNPHNILSHSIALGMLLHPVKHYIVFASCIPFSSNDGKSSFATTRVKITWCALWKTNQR